MKTKNFFINRAEKRLNNGFNFDSLNYDNIIEELELENEEYEYISWEELKDKLINNGWKYYDFEDAIITNEYAKELGLIVDDEYDDIVEELVKNNLERAILEKEERIEASIQATVKYKREFTFLEKDVRSVIRNLDVLGSTDWYKNILLMAGYSERVAKRKNRNIWDDALIDKLDDWYKTELYPKLCNTFQNQGIRVL